MEIIIQRYKDPLYHLCIHLCKGKSAADDLFQDTWVKVLGNIQHFDSERSFKNWLFTISTNLYRDRWRKYKRWLHRVKDYYDTDILARELENFKESTPGPVENLLDREQARQLHNCLGELPDKLRIAVILYYFQELSIQEISEILGIPPGTVKSRLYGARTQLRNLLEVER